MTKQKREAQFVVAGKVKIKLAKFPGKRGKISCYPDEWSVMLVVEKPDGIMTVALRGWDEDFSSSRDHYDRLRDVLAIKKGKKK